MFTCSKTYAEVPFAHRQHRHGGHCAFIHGHNWTFTFTFGCHTLDENGFVVDFGDLKYIRRWFDENLDHACVFNRDDPEREKITAAAPAAYKVYLVDSCSAEGLAKHLFEVVDALVKRETQGRVFVVEVRVDEDARNSATFSLRSSGIRHQ
ncbi:MAG: 6-carboxytetrahydropterin synthase [Puniceicoccales bacterium]|jgi:6-pyruvoyltetrahydropterin/6-carboxytetrahydropterin synthase|nr:6-carboxytetrahydropterin synthase [Puniceicoccales bacterium]